MRAALSETVSVRTHIVWLFLAVLLGGVSFFAGLLTGEANGHRQYRAMYEHSVLVPSYLSLDLAKKLPELSTEQVQAILVVTARIQSQSDAPIPEVMPIEARLAVALNQPPNKKLLAFLEANNADQRATVEGLLREQCRDAPETEAWDLACAR